MAICVCKPLVIVNGALAVKAPVSMTCNVPVELPGGVPATNRLDPLKNPTVAAETGIGALKVGGTEGLLNIPLKFTLTTLGGTGVDEMSRPPHSEPQFRIKAVESLVSVGSKTAL